MYLVRPPYLLTRLYPKALWRADRFSRKIYLTFDDGPVEAATPLVLDMLNRYRVPATFFCVGDNVVKNRPIFERIVAEGHAVGNHSFHHVNGWNTDTKKYLQDVEDCAKLFHSDLFRPPYGRMKPAQYSALRRRYRIILWDVLSADYDAGTSKEQCLQNVLKNVRNGSVVVFHDSLKALRNMEYALPRFIEEARNRGFEFALFQDDQFLLNGM